MLVALLVGVLAMIGVRYLARNPRARRRALRRAGSAWLGVEDVARRSTRRLRRRGAAEEIARIARQALGALDDWPVVWSFARMPPVVNQFYGHGSFMGAAPSLLADERWRRILAFLMPDVYREVRLAVDKGAAARAIIPMFENNPVMCAFGVWRGVRARAAGAVERTGAYDLAGLEWDVFLSGDQVEAWEDAAGPEREAILARLVDTMVIAHATSADTVQEHIGLCQWGDVRKTRKTALGGVEPRAWLDLFARALRLSGEDDLATAIGRMSVEPRVHSEEACLDQTFAEPWTPEQAIAVYREATGRQRFSVVLEIKSLRSTAGLLADVVRELNRRGIHVEAVGSFLAEEIRGVSATDQLVLGERLSGPREVLFLHFAGDLQLACDRDQLPPGSSAMFNGASLLVARAADGRYTYEVDRVAVDGLEAYRRAHGLHLGLYVQEDDCDAAAAGLLSDLVRERPETFELGFAWGGLLDEVAIEAGLGDHRGFGGQRVLQRFGYAAAWRAR